MSGFGKSTSRVTASPSVLDLVPTHPGLARRPCQVAGDLELLRDAIEADELHELLAENASAVVVGSVLDVACSESTLRERLTGVLLGERALAGTEELRSGCSSATTAGRCVQQLTEDTLTG